MAPRVKNIFTRARSARGRERLRTLFENPAVKIERIVSNSRASPPGFWYDQAEDEWVVVLKGGAVLEFAGGELVELKTGDHVTIPRHARHRVRQTGPDTVWLAVRAKR